MSQQNSSSATQNGAIAGLLNELTTAIRLTFDGRVPFYLKLLLPIAALIYWVWPLDLMPGLPFDDIAVMAIALHFFVQLANQGLNQQQGPAGRSPVGQGATSTPQSATSGDSNVVDTTWRRVE